jgi:hypothetical protein
MILTCHLQNFTVKEVGFFEQKKQENTVGNRIPQRRHYYKIFLRILKKYNFLPIGNAVLFS